jgi:hypothetical protein
VGSVSTFILLVESVVETEVESVVALVPGVLLQPLQLHIAKTAGKTTAIAIVLKELVLFKLLMVYKF